MRLAHFRGTTRYLKCATRTPELAYTKFTRDSFRDLGAFWKRRDSRVNWVRFEAGRDSQREFIRLHRRITVTSSI